MPLNQFVRVDEQDAGSKVIRPISDQLYIGAEDRILLGVRMLVLGGYHDHADLRGWAIIGHCPICVWKDDYTESVRCCIEFSA